MVAGRVDALGGDMRGVSRGRRVIEPDHPARLHWVGGNAVAVDTERDNMRCRGKGAARGVAVAGLPLEAQIAGNLR